MSIQVCRDLSDIVVLYLPQRLYLKSFAKLNISVQLPAQKVHGKSLSNWELMEKLRKMIHPDNFSILKVSKHSSEVIRFDAELENRQKLDRVLARLEDRIIQLTDYPDPLKVKVSEVKSDFPNRHSWDSFFRDATDMDEMKPGERPDTIHIKNLPIRWFVHERDGVDAPPSESIFKKVMEKYGNVRQVDIPAADPFRMQMKMPMRGITIPAQEASSFFEGYVQFSEYSSFVRCMDSLRGCKLLRRNEDIAEWCSIQVDFDKTKHMTDAAVKRRSIVRERLSARQRAKAEEEKQEKEKIAKREAKERQKIEDCEQEKLTKMREREEKRKKKQLAKLMAKDNVDLNKRVAEEQRNLLKAQKRLQAIRLIEELFKRIELRPDLHHNSKKSTRYYNESDCYARQRIVDNYKQQQEKALEEQRERLRHALDGRIVIRSALETKKPKRESSISSISEDERDRKRVKSEKLTTPEREVIYNKTAGMYGYPGPPYGFGYAFPAVPPHYAYPQTPAPYFRADGRARGRGRGRGRARGRLPYFDGPDATHQYYQYFKKLTEAGHRNEHDTRSRSRSRSRSHSRRRSYSRSRSRSRRRSYSRSRSRSRRSRSRRSRSRSRTRRSRSRSRRSRSHSHSNSRSRRRSKSKSRRSKTKSRSKSRCRTPSPKRTETQPRADDKHASPEMRHRSRSWSLSKEGEKSWSKSPKK